MTRTSPLRIRDVDLITFEVIKNALSTVGDEMALMMMRSAFSGIIRDVLDFSTALCAPDGRMITQGLSLPLHLGSFPAAMGAVLQHYGDDFQPGDVVITNDPYDGGMHLPDIFVVRPIHHGKVLVAFAVAVAHHTDIGGRVPGGSAADSREIYEEGLRIPIVKYDEAGRRNNAVADFIRLNVRLPDTVLGDLDAQVAGCRAGEVGYLRLVSEYGLEQLNQTIEAILDYTEQVTRSEIEKWPDGVYEYTDYEDHNGIEPQLVPIHVKARIHGSEITFDFTGTSPQLAGSINCTESFAQSAVYIAVRSLVGQDIPNNAGYFRPIHIHIPKGTVLNPNPPAAFGARGVIGFRTLDAVFGALAQALPDAVPAAGDGGTTGIRMGGYHSDGRPFQINDITCGSWGGRPNRDGLEGVAHFAANIANRSIEVAEAEDPMRVRRYSFRPDSGGAGRFRGGLAIERELEFLGESAVLQVRSHRRDYPPYGLNGGRPGTPSMTFLTRKGRRTPVPTKFTGRVQRGDVIYHVTAGGGGHGDPLVRDPSAVARDIALGKQTAHYARKEYGVVLDRRGLVDAASTRKLRALMSRSQKVNPSGPLAKESPRPATLDQDRAGSAT